jgi:hypothetical protein
VLVTAILAATAALMTTPAAAAPGTDDEGGTVALRTALDEANKGYLDAQAALDASVKRQAELTDQSAKVDAQLAVVRAQTDQIAVAAYRSGGLRVASALLDSSSPDHLLDKATTLNIIALHNDKLLHQLSQLAEQVTTTRTAIDAEVVSQRQQLDVMAKKKQQAEVALKTVGGKSSSGVPGASKPANAAAAPRSANGTLPNESCSVNDPTTSGCITPRLLNAFEQAKAAGFTHFVSCYRSGGGGEHPKGRACDFAADPSTFGGVATGADRTYGNNLAAYFVANAANLGVLYVIWFKQIWMPASGWRTYNSGNGDPSSDHTNHVHLSVV